ncbi:glucosyltransferase domain-containing protein [Pseudomonas putida]
MSAAVSWNRQLSHREIFGLCMIAIGLHVLPLILADYSYIDDIWRSLRAGRVNGAYDSWAGQGRVLIDWLHAMLGFAPASPDLFPLPLLLVIPVVAWSFARLVQHYFEAPNATAVLVVLPLWFNPFFLQNLSYQYDAPGMALALAACAWAITLGAEHWKQFVAGSLLVAVAASLYQVSLNVFAGLVCIEIVRRVLDDQGLAQVARHLAARMLQLAAGCLVYYLTAYQLITVVRTSLLPLDSQWPLSILIRLGLTAGHLSLLVTSGTAWLFYGLLALAVLGLAGGVYRVLTRQRPLAERLGLVIALLLAVVASVLLISGMALLFSYYDGGARLLLGFGPVLVMAALLAHWLLTRVNQRASWLLALPVLFMLSFSFAYGRVLVLHKQLQQEVASSLAQVIETHPKLQAAKSFKLGGINVNRGWIPAAQGSYATMPALQYILNIRWTILPESMPRVGMSLFDWPGGFDQEVLQSQPVVESKLFSIYLDGDVGYVMMKPLPRANLAP